MAWLALSERGYIRLIVHMGRSSMRIFNRPLPFMGLYKSAFWSLLGNVVPMLAALAAVPFLMRYLEQERLGVLSLVWIVVGYFSFLDMGLGRAVTIAVAQSRARANASQSEELHVVGTACVVLLCVGTAMGLMLALAVAFWGVPLRLSSPAFLKEVELALLWMLPSLPLLLLSSGLRGQLEGAGAFRELNLLRAPTGVMLVAGPCVTALYSPDLSWACASILIVRLVHVLILLRLVATTMGLPAGDCLRSLAGATSWTWLRQLMLFGGWASVSNVVGPAIVYLDRFVIGAVLAASSVVIYAVPFDVVSRLPVLVASLCSVLLPELARLSRSTANDQDATGAVRRLIWHSSALSGTVVFTAVILGWMATPSALRWWLGSDFEQQSTFITQLLLLAFGVNALAQIPVTALQAAGRIRSVALLHMAEVLPYGLAVFCAISWLGIVGAAWAWLLRSVIDYLILAWMWNRHAARLKAGVTV